MKVDLIKVLWW